VLGRSRDHARRYLHNNLITELPAQGIFRENVKLTQLCVDSHCMVATPAVLQRRPCSICCVASLCGGLGWRVRRSGGLPSCVQRWVGGFVRGSHAATLAAAVPTSSVGCSLGAHTCLGCAHVRVCAVILVIMRCAIPVFCTATRSRSCHLRSLTRTSISLNCA